MLEWIYIVLAYIVSNFLVLKLLNGKVKDVVFSLLNCGFTYYAFFYRSNIDFEIFAIYFGFVFVFWLLLRNFAAKENWLFFLAMLPPIIWLMVFKFEQLLPLIGISFMSFRLVLTVYELSADEDLKPKITDFFGFAFYSPTFLIGPISPYSLYKQSLDSKFTQHPSFDACLIRMIIGTLKFVVLANIVLQLGIEGLLKDGHYHASWELIFAAFFNFLYLYFNFSGINDISMGVAGILKFRIKENFDSPMKAKNIQDFWSRWHISLSDLVRDVFFTPLNIFLLRNIRFIPAKILSMFAILMSFIVIGLWHEFSLRYFIFGVLHGAGVILSIYLLVPLQDFIAEKGNKFLTQTMTILSRTFVIIFVSLVSAIAVINPKDYAFIFDRVLGII